MNPLTQTQKSFIQPYIMQSQFSHKLGFKIMSQGDPPLRQNYIHRHVHIYIISIVQFELLVVPAFKRYCMFIPEETRITILVSVLVSYRQLNVRFYPHFCLFKSPLTFIQNHQQGKGTMWKAIVTITLKLDCPESPT